MLGMKIVKNKNWDALQYAAVGMVNDVRTISRRFFSEGQGISHDGQRDIYAVYGYSRTRVFRDYFQAYRLQDVANRVVGSVAKSSWRDGALWEIDGEQVLEEESRTLRKVGLFKFMERADILNRIGKFSVLYVGVPDGRKPDKPLGTSTKEKLKDVFFTPYAEDGITINKWDMNPISPRFGMPEMYTLQVQDRGEKDQDLQTKARSVHWSRIIHLSEGALDGSVEGISSLEPIFNRLVDLDKAIGGAAEAYFRNARGKYSLEAEKGFTGLLDEQAKKDLSEEVERFTNNWSDVMRLSGVSAKVLTTQHADPVGTVRVALQAIAGATGIPMRILTGEGAGQLAGNEDKESYNQLVSDRQNLVCTDWFSGVYKILENAEMLEVPFEADIKWPVASALNEKDMADIHERNSIGFKNVTESLGTPVMQGVDRSDVFLKVLDMELDIEDDEIEEPEPVVPGEPPEGGEEVDEEPNLQAVNA
jgi:hypothetical protein